MMVKYSAAKLRRSNCNAKSPGVVGGSGSLKNLELCTGWPVAHLLRGKSEKKRHAREIHLDQLHRGPSDEPEPTKLLPLLNDAHANDPHGYVPVAGQILARERNNPGQSLRRQGPPAGARLALPNPPRASAGMLALQYDRILTTKRPPEGGLCICDLDFSGGRQCERALA
jgi:hypothetical protein